MEAVKGADAFQKAALPIVIVCSILTVAMGAMLFPLPSFSTDLTAFSPETDADDAESRMMAHFPAESRPMFIHIEGKSGENVLSIESLQEQNRVLQSILNESERGGHYIDSSITAPGILDLALDEAESEMTLAEIDDWTTFFDEVLEENTTCGQAADDERALAAAAFIEAAMISNDADLLGVCDWLTENRQGALSEPTASSTLWVLMIDPSLDDGERQGFQHWIRVQLDANTAEGGNALTYRSTSIDLVSHDINRGTLGELAQLVFGAVIVVVLLLAVAFRSLRGVAFPMVGLTSALVWTYGGLAAVGVHFSVLEVAVAPVVLGLGIDYSIHLQRRYDAFRAEGLEAAAAWLRGFETLRMALGLAVITTIAAFMANIASPLEPVRTFGFALALGVFSAFLASTLLVGALHVVMERSTESHSKGHAWARFGRFSEGMTDFQRKQQAKVVGVVALMTVGAVIVAAANLETRFDLTDFLDEEMEVMQVRGELYDHYNASGWKPVYILSEPADHAAHIEDTPEFLNALAIQDVFIASANGVVSPHSTGSRSHPVYDGIYPVLFEAAEADPAWAATYHLEVRDGDLSVDHDNYQIGDTAAALANLSLNQSTADPLTGDTWADRVADVVVLDTFSQEPRILYTRTEIYVEAHTSENTAQVLMSIRDVVDRTDALPGMDARMYVTGDLVRLEAVLDGLTESQIESTAISLATCFIVLLALTRRIGPALLVTLPVGIAAAWVVGAMAVLNLNWNVLTVMITALTIGLGIDYSIHIWRRFEAMRQREGDVWAGMREMYASTGVALLLSAGTTICGFAVLLLSQMPVVQDFGIVTAITVFFSVVLALFLLPILLAVDAGEKVLDAEL